EKEDEAAEAAELCRMLMEEARLGNVAEIPIRKRLKMFCDFQGLIGYEAKFWKRSLEGDLLHTPEHVCFTFFHTPSIDGGFVTWSMVSCVQKSRTNLVEQDYDLKAEDVVLRN
ncbi:hypothetical protein Tco_0204000, partial [Tanacetum coccineum]